jgi:hypothetical protein
VPRTLPAVVAAIGASALETALPKALRDAVTPAPSASCRKSIRRFIASILRRRASTGTPSFPMTQNPHSEVVKCCGRQNQIPMDDAMVGPLIPLWTIHDSARVNRITEECCQFVQTSFEFLD